MAQGAFLSRLPGAESVVRPDGTQPAVWFVVLDVMDALRQAARKDLWGGRVQRKAFQKSKNETDVERGIDCDENHNFGFGA